MKYKRKTLDKVFYKSLGIKLHRLRRTRNLSLRELASMTGLSRMTLDNYELGKARIDYDSYKLICDALEMPDTIDVELNLGIGE